MNEKLLPVLGAGLWILGLILSIVGLNIHSATGTWISVIGNSHQKRAGKKYPSRNVDESRNSELRSTVIRLLIHFFPTD